MSAHAQAIGDNLARLRRLIDLFQNFDSAKLSALLAALQALRAAPDTKSKVQAALALLKLGSELTPTEFDDAIIGSVDWLLQTDAIMAIVVRLVDKYLNAGAGAQVAFSEDEVTEVQALGLDWAGLIFLVKQLVEIIQLLRS